MTRTRLQIIRQGAEWWHVYSLTEVFKGAVEHELVGKVCMVDGMYVVEVPHWHADGYEWYRLEKRYQLPDAAFRAIGQRREKQS